MKLLTNLVLLLIILARAGTLCAQTDVLTQHNDLARTGWNNTETTLLPTNVSSSSFGLLFNRSVDDQVYAQPLVATGIQVGGTPKNIVYVATVNNSVYAYDADDGSVPVYWQVSLTPSGMRPPTSSDMHPSACGNNYNDISGQFGIIGTPVIDKSTNTLYVVSRYVNASQIDNGPHNIDTLYTSKGYFQLLHALDLSTGAEKFGGPVNIQASYPGTGPGSSGGIINFDPRRENQRPGLLLLNGIVYICFGGHCDWNNYNGWVIGYSAANLQQKLAYVTTPNDSRGGIWQSGSAPAVDANGNIFLAAGNSENGDASVAENRGESLIKIKPNANATAFNLVDFYTPSNYVGLNNSDYDFGCQILLVPNSKLMLAGCKDGNIYVLDQTNMGGYNPTTDKILQKVPVSTSAQMHSSFAYFGPPGPATKYVYQFSETTTLKAYPIKANSLGTPINGTVQGPDGAAGAFMSVSSPPNASSGILWISHAKAGCNANQNTCPGILRAVNALDVTKELWNSDQNSSDNVGNYAKTSCPTVANGKVYLATFSNKLNVYGLVANNTLCKTNVALNKPAVATSTAGGSPGAAFDGDMNSFWLSNATNTQAIYVDLGSEYNVCRVIINWATKFNGVGRNFNIEVSDDNVTYTAVDKITNNTNPITEFDGNVTARYVRMNGLRQSTFNNGFAIDEMQVLGTPASSCTTPNGLKATAITMNTATLNWTAVPTATSYLVSYKSSLVSSWVTRTTSATSIAISALTPGSDYLFMVQATCSSVQSAAATGAFSTKAQPNPCLLLTRYFHADIGDIGTTGSSCFANNTFTVSGSGLDIAGTSDEFQFAWTSLAGDFEYVSRIASQDNTAPFDKAGIMMRDSLSNTSRFAFMGLTSANGMMFIYRNAVGSNAVTVNGPAVKAPYYVKLTKKGTVYTGFVSSTGLDNTWSQVGSADLGFGSSAINVGYAVTSTLNASLSTATFDNAESDVLPINLLSFAATLVDNKYVAISWVTSMEHNNDYFEVQKSSDGVHFDDLVRVASAGNSDVSQSYSTADNNPLNGINFYRLKQVDLDGRVSYFPAVVVRFGQTAGPIVYPNPVVSLVNVVAGNEAIESVTLFTVTGRTLLTVNNDAASTMLSIQTGNLASGIYILKVKTAGRVYQQKLVKE
jgi:F5/8 type C domain/Secretion system C-terminal sorting domain/Fibronectin type III domain